MRHRTPVTVALLSLSLLALELTWTRIFSAEFFYAFAFLVLSLAVLGLGLGALSLRLFPRIDRPGALPVLLSLTGLAMIAGPPLVFRLGLDFGRLFHSPGTAGRLLLAVLILGSSYLFGGAALALLFRRNHREIARLYMADLTGAGVGILLVIPLMNRFGTPAATFLCALPVLAAAALESRGWVRLVPAVLAAGVGFIAPRAPSLLEAPREEPAPVVYRHWDAVAKLKIYEREPGLRGLNIDNVANSPVFEFDGNWDRPDSLRFGFNIDVGNLIRRFDRCTFLSLGAGGGGDVLQALQAGAASVHAVEVVPEINRLLTTGELAGYTGHIYADPRVVVATEDARAYVRRHPGRFDVIYSLSSNTFAALASGSFALAENYLFTTEAFRDYWNALTPRGFLSMEHQFYMPRLVSAVHDALAGLGIPDPERHFAIYKLPALRRHVLLLSREPLTEEVIQTAYGPESLADAGQMQLLYPPPAGREGNPYARIVANGWRAEQDSLPIDISPATDERPFVAQLGLWKNFHLGQLPKSGLAEFGGFPMAKLLITAILLLVLLFVVPLNLLPHFRARPEGTARLRAVPSFYFFTIGVAFMAVEVILIQKYTLFIGPSVHSVITVLCTILAASALGSRVSRSVDDRVPFLGIAAWLTLEILCFGRLTTLLGGWGMVPRILVSAALIAPLGFLMGMPFPKAAHRVGPLVDWGFAVNGAASVVGSTAVMLLAFSGGFRVALAAAALLYLAALGLLRREAAWETNPALGGAGGRTSVSGDPATHLNLQVAPRPVLHLSD